MMTSFLGSDELSDFDMPVSDIRTLCVKRTTPSALIRG